MTLRDLLKSGFKNKTLFRKMRTVKLYFAALAWSQVDNTGTEALKTKIDLPPQGGWINDDIGVDNIGSPNFNKKESKFSEMICIQYVSVMAYGLHRGQNKDNRPG